MNELFLKILNMSITASWIVLAIIVLRLLLKKAPKAIVVLLWGLVGFRLICPFSIESVMSIIPSTETVPQEILYTNTPEIHSGIPALNSTINPIIADIAQPTPEASIESVHTITDIASVIWAAGACLMLLYIFISYLRIYFKVREAVNTEDQIWQCDNISTPFILGVFRPRIYLPSSITEQDMLFVVAHEKAHLKRRDHLWKPLGFLLLSVYWFNPVLWAAYILLCRDIELACDEKVVKEYGTQIKKEYSTALLNCSVPRKMISACPVAFGEVGVKARIKSILNYKKPAFWVIIVAIIVSVVAAVCLLTDPKKDELNIKAQKSGADLKGITLEIINTDLTYPDPFLEIKWKNESGEDVMYGAEHHIYKEVNGKWEECCENCDIWTLEGYELQNGKESNKIYGIGSMNMLEAGKYRFETPFSIRSGNDTDNMAWLEFELEKGVSGKAELLFEAKELVFSNGSFSYVQSAEAAPLYHLENGMQLYEETKNGIVYQVGLLERIKLDENNFDTRFSAFTNAWVKGYSIEELKKNNVRAWHAYVNEGSRIYLLLEQSDGSFYLGFGYYDVDKSDVYNNSDGSYIRWLYKLESKAKTQRVAYIAGDGAVYYYSKSFLRYDVPQYSFFYQTTDDELKLLLDYLEGAEWVKEDLTQDIELYFNGQVYYNGHWIYFGYEDNIFYCDEYYCKDTPLPISQLQVMATNAVEYPPANIQISNMESEDRGIAKLKEKYPEYFGVNTSNGVEVYIWQMSKNNYSCVLLPDKNEAYTIEDLMDYHKKAVSIEEMRLILSTYNLAKNDITLVPTAMPYSSYWYTIDEEYRKELEAMFRADVPVNWDYGLSSLTDSVEFDIDGDGISESVGLGIGPTSGIFTFTLTVRENGELEYFNIFESGAAIDMNFNYDNEGNVVLKGEALTPDDPEIVVYNMGVEDGNVYLTFDNHKKRVPYWGTQGLRSQYAPKE